MGFTAIHLYFDDVAVGQDWESPARTVTEADVVNFAGLSGDFNPMHVDHEFARGTPFRGPIAHGLLIQAIGSGLGLYSPPMRTLAILETQAWRFVGPVHPGDTIHVRTRLIGKEPRGRGRRGIITWQRQILNQESKVVQEGTTLTMVESRSRGDEQGVAPADQEGSPG